LDFIQSSALFDEKWYLAHNPDLVEEINRMRHYLLFGGFQGRDPILIFRVAGIWMCMKI